MHAKVLYRHRKKALNILNLVVAKALWERRHDTRRDDGQARLVQVDCPFPQPQFLFLGTRRPDEGGTEGRTEFNRVGPPEGPRLPKNSGTAPFIFDTTPRCTAILRKSP